MFELRCYDEFPHYYMDIERVLVFGYIIPQLHRIIMSPLLKISAWLQLGHTRCMTMHLEPPTAKNFRNHPWGNVIVRKQESTFNSFFLSKQLHLIRGEIGNLLPQLSWIYISKSLHFRDFSDALVALKRMFLLSIAKVMGVAIKKCLAGSAPKPLASLFLHLAGQHSMHISPLKASLHSSPAWFTWNWIERTAI